MLHRCRSFLPTAAVGAATLVLLAACCTGAVTAAPLLDATAARYVACANAAAEDDFQTCNSTAAFYAACANFSKTFPVSFDCDMALNCPAGTCCAYKALLNATTDDGVKWVNNVLVLCSESIAAHVQDANALTKEGGEDGLSSLSCQKSRDTSGVGQVTDECLARTDFMHGVKKLTLHLKDVGLSTFLAKLAADEIIAKLTIEDPSSLSTSLVCLKLEDAWETGLVVGTMIKNLIAPETTKNSLGMGDDCGHTAALGLLDSHRNPNKAFDINSLNKALAMVARGAAYVARVSGTSCNSTALDFSYWVSQ